MAVGNGLVVMDAAKRKRIGEILGEVLQDLVRFNASALERRAAITPDRHQSRIADDASDRPDGSRRFGFWLHKWLHTPCRNHPLSAVINGLNVHVGGVSRNAENSAKTQGFHGVF